MNEEFDCRVCDYYELVYEEYPSNDEPILVFSFHRCSAFNKIYFSIGELEKAYKSCSKKSIKIGYGIPGETIKEIKLINLSFRQIIGKKEDLIKITPEQSSFISSPCQSWVDFATKIGALASVLEMNIDALREVISSYEDNWRGLKLLETLFVERGKYNDDLKMAFNLLRDIVTLRNKIAPYHPPSEKEAAEILKRLGITLTASLPTEWQRNADILLKKFLSALQKLREQLSSVALEV